MADWDLPVDPLAALREGDPVPFEAFVRDHARRFFAFFRRQGAGLHEAEDLTQEVFLKLHSNAARYRPRERVAAYCLRVARNVWIDHRRRASARVATVPTASAGAVGAVERDPSEVGAALARPAPAEEAPDARAELVEESERARAALRELPEHHRLVFELGVVEGLAYPEIARLLDVPVGTVKSRMFHAVRKLRAIVEAREEGAA